MRISPPAPAWIPLVDCLTTLQRLEFSPTAGVPRLSSGPNRVAKNPNVSGKRDFHFRARRRKSSSENPSLGYTFPFVGSRNAQVSPTVVHSRPGYDLLHLLYDPGRSFAGGTILRTRREVGRLTKE